MLTQEAYRHPEIAEETGAFSVVRSNPIGLFFIDTEGRFRHINERAVQIFGFAGVDDGQGRPLSQLEFFLSREIVDQIYRLFHEDQPFKINGFPGTNLVGHFAHYCLACNRAVDPDGNLRGVFGIIEDVSDQMKRQQEFQDRVDELSLLSQISQVAASALDTDEVLKVILTGVTARQGLGFNRAFLFLLEEDQKTLSGYVAVGPSSAEEAGYIWSSLEHDNRTLSEILSLYQQESIRTNHSLTDLIRGMQIDITNGSLFAQSMREQRPIVVESATALDIITEQVLERMGKKEVAMTPLVSRNRSIGLLVVDNAITHKEITDHDRRFLKLIADQTAAALERSYLYRDIKERAAELELMNRKLAETQNQIIEAEKMSVIGEITSAVAHELRNPLTIIGGFANLMHRNMEPGSGDAEYLNIIISETQRAEAVLTDVLDFSRASRVKDKPLNVNAVIRSVIDMLTVRLGNGKSRFKLSLCEQELPMWGNEAQMIHALYQIYSALPQDLPTEVTPRITTRGTGEISRMEIGFEPIGRQSDKVEKVLKQYFGSGNSTKRLSLLVAEETLKHHGGSLAVESSPERGPVLSVEIPLYKERIDVQNHGG
jgi:PAS domain S-box-containing protein